jgi:hypothetical protein
MGHIKVKKKSLENKSACTKEITRLYIGKKHPTMLPISASFGNFTYVQDYQGKVIKVINICFDREF